MDKQVLKFNLDNMEMWFRFDIQALYNIEKSGYSPFDIISQSNDAKAVRCFLQHGLADWYDDLENDYNDIDDYVNAIMSKGDFQTKLIALLQAAILLALPKAPIGNRRKIEDNDTNILSLMTLFVDVMGAPRFEFMKSSRSDLFLKPPSF